MSTPEIPLIALSNGGGRDSATLWCLAKDGELLIDGVKHGVDDLDANVFSDPGYEWPHTYTALMELRRRSTLAGVPFYSLDKPPEEEWEEWISEPRSGTDIPPWQARLTDENVADRAAGGFYHRRAPIVQDYTRNQNVTLRANAGCTQNHKSRVINRWLDDFAKEIFGIGNVGWSHRVRKGLVKPHILLIGIAADEASRAEGAEGQLGVEAYVTKKYPLLEAGITKADEEAILKRHGLNWIRKSGCVGCHFQPDGWFWALRETEPELWSEIVSYEALALTKNGKRFLRGDKPIDKVVEKWRRINPRATIDEVLDKSYLRGCGAEDA